MIAEEYFLAVQSFALIRNCQTRPSTTRARIDEIRSILSRFGETPYCLAIPLTEHDVDSGYTQWAPRYDGPNPAIAVEEPIVAAMLSEAPAGGVLDAACGTGRWSEKLAAAGHNVIGVDSTEAMLAIARAKVPSADFRSGRLEKLPVDDHSVDLVVCALALTHAERLEPVILEFSRVLRPGGRAVISDMHPFAR